MRIALALAAALTLGAVGQASATPYTVTTISVPGSLGTEAFGINNAGQVVGDDFNPLAVVFNTGFVKTGATFTSIAYPDPVAFSDTAFGINAGGQIVGYLETARTNYGFLYSGGSYTGLRNPEAINDSPAYGINSSGEVVGLGFTYRNGTFTSLNAPGAFVTEGHGINDRGDIVGTYFDGANNISFLDVNGVFSKLVVPGAKSTTAWGINNHEAIVGSFVDASGTHGFLDTSGVFTTLGVPGVPYGINDAGDIVGTFTNQNDRTRGFVAVPIGVPEPTALLLLAPGFAALAFARRCSRPG